jgi:hypothetical protein
MADETPNDRSEKENHDGIGDSSRDEGQGRRSGRHRGFRGRHGGRMGGPDPLPGGEPRVNGSNREDQGRNPKAEEGRDMPLCPICGKSVYDLSTAISASRESSEPAHFDCVLERVTASESITAGEKLVYLGSGAFGVVEFKDKSDSAFSVKRRIQWEKEGEKKDWRKGISSRITNL